MVIFDTVFVYFEGTHWNYKLLCFVTSFAMTVLFINGYFLSITKKPNGTSSCFVNNLVNFEFFQFLIIGVFIYAFPDQFCFGLSEPNESYRSLTRAVGANVLAASFQAFFVSDFVSNQDKRSFFLSRFIVNQVELVLIIICLFESNILIWYIIINVVYTLFTYYAYITIPSEEKTKSN